MTAKMKVMQKIHNAGIVAVVRAENSETAKRITDACMAGGVAAVEITFTVPRAHKVIEELAVAYQDTPMILGAGTVMDTETARIAILSGAQYVVTPYMNTDVVRLCNRYAVPCMPGAMSITEAVKGMEAGADVIKIFPGELFGPAIIKAIKGPVPYAQLMPTGGVTVENVDQWIKAGAFAVGAGSSLTAGAKEGNYGKITEIGKQFVEKIKEARGLC